MLSELNKKNFVNLIKSSTVEEIIWMSGYMSGILSIYYKKKIKNNFNYKITLVYSTVSGNSKNLAFSMIKKAKEKKLNIKLIDLDLYNLIDLKNENYFFIIISTHGEGEPPSSAKSFFNFIHKEKNLNLKNIKYSVLALGDRSYTFFCKAGEDIDKRLYKLGASRIIPLYKCDVTDFKKKADDWFIKIFTFFKLDINIEEKKKLMESL
ncbi:flavodoxin domain-containing protein [Blattabacterium cuenoti]|uniref:flavodoxin domain-containing protein n=1 Tax=Blattabacterium cuenoti TaxID=1653831 RepID=UPI001EEB7E9E|nr:flavodoxin domain-containing protein [Blattabacterium cuenoti]